MVNPPVKLIFNVSCQGILFKNKIRKITRYSIWYHLNGIIIMATYVTILLISFCSYWLHYVKCYHGCSYQHNKYWVILPWWRTRKTWSFVEAVWQQFCVCFKRQQGNRDITFLTKQKLSGQCLLLLVCFCQSYVLYVCN